MDNLNQNKETIYILEPIGEMLPLFYNCKKCLK